jgi:hypothetical protein
MKKLIFRGPVQTASGYGVHARMLLKVLDESGKFDITVMSVPWGVTPLIYDDTLQQKRIRELASKFNPNVPQEYDISVQVTIPNEFMKLAKKNVGVTAGIETNRVAALWQTKCNEICDVVVVPSTHSARGFTQSIFNGDKGPDQLLLRKPLYILPEWVNKTIFNADAVVNYPDTISTALTDMPDFNFVTVGLGLDKADGEDRKNFALLIKWFCEQFKGNMNVGLVLKLAMVNASPVDFKNVKGRIQAIKQAAGCGQFPKIKLIHGRLSDLELATLYKHPKIKAFVTTTHGEGYGLPIIEAAACGLPVIATNWSGHLDFLKIDGKNRFVAIDAPLMPVPASCVWKDVMEEGTLWANPTESDTKLKMAKVVLSYDKPKEWAIELAKHIAENITEDLGKQWAEDMHKLACDEPVKLTKNVMVKTASLEKTLPITLVAATGYKFQETTKALQNSLHQVKFEKTKMFVPMGMYPELHLTIDAVAGVMNQFENVQDYDTFITKELHQHIDTTHALMIQWDGYVLNGSAWDDKFLEYDFVGAPWFWDGVVGNAGFALISKKLLEELSKPEYDASPFDINLCRKYRKQLEDKGFKWAPPELAAKFSCENQPYEGQFGWHGTNPNYGE